MSVLISIYFGIKGLAILLGTVISGGDNELVSLRIEALEIMSDTVWVRVTVNGLYAEELDSFFDSGTEIPLTVDAQLLAPKVSAARSRALHLARYDLLQKTYRVVRYRDTLYLPEKAPAKSAFGAFRLPLIPLHKMKANLDYTLEVQAHLGKVRLDILDMAEFDLMSLWKFKVPSLRTRPFTRKALEATLEDNP